MLPVELELATKAKRFANMAREVGTVLPNADLSKIEKACRDAQKASVVKFLQSANVDEIMAYAGRIHNTMNR